MPTTGRSITKRADNGRYVGLAPVRDGNPVPIRVAQVMGKMLGGGVESVVMNYYRHIDRSKVQFDFLVDADSTRVPEEEIKALGGRVFRIPPYQHPLRYRKELVRLFHEEHWPIVHSHINTLSVFPLSAAKKAGVPVRIAHSHSTMGKGELAKNLMKLALRPLSNLYPTERLACSEYAGKWLFGRNADFTVIPNAIELEKFRFDPVIRQETRRELGIADDMFLVGHVGRFMPQKNQAFLVDVLAELLPQKPDTMLAFVGDGPDRPDVQQHAQALGIGDHILFLGQRTDVSHLYQAFDAFCLPSRYEGLGMVAIEAQVAGCPCVLSDQVPHEAGTAGLSMVERSPGRRMPLRPQRSGSARSRCIWAVGIHSHSGARLLGFGDSSDTGDRQA